MEALAFPLGRLLSCGRGGYWLRENYCRMSSVPAVLQVTAALIDGGEASHGPWPTGTGSSRPRSPAKAAGCGPIFQWFLGRKEKRQRRARHDDISYPSLLSRVRCPWSDDDDVDDDEIWVRGRQEKRIDWPQVQLFPGKPSKKCENYWRKPQAQRCSMHGLLLPRASSSTLKEESEQLTHARTRTL